MKVISDMHKSLEIDSLIQGWSNVLTRGTNTRLHGHWRVGYSWIYVIYANIGC